MTPENDKKQAKYAIVLNPQQYSGGVWERDSVYLDNLLPYRGRVGKIIGEYTAKSFLAPHGTPTIVLEFDDGKQLVIPLSMVTMLENL